MNRVVHINNEEWKYKVGEGYVNIFSPSGTRHNISLNEVTGEEWSNIERGRWKGWWKGVRPHQVKNYIENNLIKGEVNVK